MDPSDLLSLMTASDWFCLFIGSLDEYIIDFLEKIITTILGRSRHAIDDELDTSLMVNLGEVSTLSWRCGHLYLSIFRIIWFNWIC